MSVEIDMILLGLLDNLRKIIPYSGRIAKTVRTKHKKSFEP